MTHSADGDIGVTGGGGGAAGDAAHRLLDAELLRSLEGIADADKRRPYAGRFRTAKPQPCARGGRGAAARAGGAATLTAEAPGDGAAAARLAPPEGAPGLERLFQTLFAGEQDSGIHFLLDATQSMGYASAPGYPTKFRYARGLAAACGYVALARYGRFGVTAFGHARGRRQPRLRGRSSAGRLFSYLDGVAPGGSRDFSHSVLDFAQRAAESPGVCVVLSDFLAPQWEKAVRGLLARRFHVILVQVLDPEEVEPTFLENLRLVDGDSGASREVSVTPQVLARYRAALASFCGQLADAADRQGMGYLRVTTDVGFEDVLLRTLRAAGLLR